MYNTQKNEACCNLKHTCSVYKTSIRNLSWKNRLIFHWSILLCHVFKFCHMDFLQFEFYISLHMYSTSAHVLIKYAFVTSNKVVKHDYNYVLLHNPERMLVLQKNSPIYVCVFGIYLKF